MYQGVVTQLRQRRWHPLGQAEGCLRPQLTRAFQVLGSHGDPGSVPAFLSHPSAQCSAGAVKQKGAASEKPSAPLPRPSERRGNPSKPHLCVWSHAAVPNSISSCSPVWTQAAGGRLGLCSLAHPPRLVLMALPYPKLPGSPLWWWLCPLCPVAFPCNHTTQGKECLGQRGRAALRDPALPLPPDPSPRSLFKMRLSLVLPSSHCPASLQAEGLCLLWNHCKPQNPHKVTSQLSELGRGGITSLLLLPFGLNFIFEFKCLTQERGAGVPGSWSFQFRKGSGPGREHRSRGLPACLFPSVLCYMSCWRVSDDYLICKYCTNFNSLNCIYSQIKTCINDWWSWCHRIGVLESFFLPRLYGLEPTSRREGLFIQVSTVFGYVVIKLLRRDTHITHEETEPPKVNYPA